MENKDFDKLFRDAFEAAEATPSDRVWQGIEATLEQEKEKIVPMAKRRPYHWAYYATAASVLLALGVVIWTMQSTKDINFSGTEIAMQEPKHSTETTEGVKLEAVEPIAPKIIDQPSPDALQVTTVSEVHLGKSPVMTAAEPPLTELPKLELQGIQEAAPSNLQTLASLKIGTELPTYRVTEIEEIKPLIESEEEMESMYANVTTDPYNRNTIVTSLLNTISENVETNNNREIRFRADEEGSIRIDIINTLVKNRNKKKR